MAGKGVVQFGGKPTKQMQADERLVRWAKRKISTGIDWRHVSATTIRAALTVCLNEGMSLTFAPAMGGRGLCIKLWDGGPETKEYAGTSEEVSELLDSLVDALGGSAEDVRLVVAGGAD